MKFQIAIFSYNRGAYLRNCIESIQKHCSGVPFTVYDDGSDEPGLVEYLDTLGPAVRKMNTATEDRHGGFYFNMQVALNETTADVLLLLQDDVQIVRRLDESEISQWADYWQRNENVAFLSPVFLKGSRRQDFLDFYQPDNNQRLYHWNDIVGKKNTDGPVPKAYMDICLLNVKRLRQVRWNFENSELLNGEKALKHFPFGMPQLADPFVFYVPEEPVYRGRVKTKGTVMAERLSGNSVKRFQSMTLQEVEAMKLRSLSIYPFAEDFINTEDPGVQRPYRFNVYRSHWIARLVNKIEKICRR